MAGKTDAQKKAQKTYMARFSRVEIRMLPEKQKRVQDHAESRGESISSFINRAVDEQIERDKRSETK